ncbi:MAG: BtpA/SgcQ family protein, partial [Myxococcota bacterium]|nr:BtpA/SgcQ family protein [Myxococcota bacterium]
MVHLLPLPGSPSGRPISEVLDLALTDAAALAGAGFDGLVVENFGDVPFRKRAVSPVTVAAMGRVLGAIRARFPDLPLCVNV